MTTASRSGGDASSARRAPGASSGATRPMAATTYVQNRAGSLSRSSSDSQAVRSSPPTQSATSVVLPKPAGAETRVRAGWSTPSSRWRRRGRSTPPRRRGVWSFDSRSGTAAVAIAAGSTRRRVHLPDVRSMRSRVVEDGWAAGCRPTRPGHGSVGKYPPRHEVPGPNDWLILFLARKLFTEPLLPPGGIGSPKACDGPS